MTDKTIPKTLQELVNSLKTSTDAFMRHVHYSVSDFGISKYGDIGSQTGICIKNRGLEDMSDDFLEALIAMILEFVYNDHQIGRNIKRIKASGHSAPQAWSILQGICKNKFREYNPKIKSKDGVQTDDDKFGTKGQFSELLLFVFLQFFFEAVPVVRKMSLTTSNKFERFGFDALHMSSDVDGNPQFFIGEAKTYDRDDYALRSAIKDSIVGVFEQYGRLFDELKLYIYDDCVTSELQQIVENYNKQIGAPFDENFVCLCSYRLDADFKGMSPADRDELILYTIREEISRMKKKPWKDDHVTHLPKLHLIMFPVCNLTDLLRDFEKGVGKWKEN